MIGKNQKRNFNKHTTVLIILICLFFIFTCFSINNSYAADVDENNETVGTAEVENQIESNGDILNTPDNDKCINDNLLSSNEDVKLKSTNNDEILSETSLLGRYFNGFVHVMDNYASGCDVHVCNDMKYRDGDSQIRLYKGMNLYTTRLLTLDADHKMSIFSIDEGADGLILSGYRFINAVGTSGSVLDIHSSNILIKDCVFENNHCEYGGVVTVHENVGNVTFLNCSFKNNSAYYDDFSGSVYAGAVNIFALNTSFINCTFNSNWVYGSEDAYAGAMLVGSDVEEIILENCEFRDNYAISTNFISQAGALMFNCFTNLTNCSFINNTAGQGGAVVFNCDGNVIDCSFINNTASDISGAIFTKNNINLNIDNVSFEANKALKGGALFIVNDNVIIKDSNFLNNHAEIKGGSLFINATNCSILNSNFILNAANELGGAIYINSTKTNIESSNFTFNKAKNGSAIYIGDVAQNIVINSIECRNNQVQAYLLSLSAGDILFNETEHINMTLIGGNNIADYNNLLISNAIYSAALNSEVEIDGVNPVVGATMNGVYRDDLGYNVGILLTLIHEDGSVGYNNTIYSSYLGQIYVDINNLKPGRYNVYVKPAEDSHYLNISNDTEIEIYAMVDAKINVYSNASDYNFADIVVWSLNITNIGYNDAYKLYVNFNLPDGLIYIVDDSDGLYDVESGILNISQLNVNEEIVYNITTKINKTGLFDVKTNITTIEFDTNLINNNNLFSFNVNDSSDLLISISANGTEFNYHDFVNWTITVKNNGPSIAHDINIFDVCGSHLIPVDFTEGFSLSDYSWNIESLDVGEEITLNLITQINATSIIVNTVNVKAREYDFNNSNNKINTSINIFPTSDLSINLTLNSTNINYLDYLTLTLTVTNNGFDNATNVKVGNILPHEFTYINSTFDFIDNEFDIGNLSVGEIVFIDIYCKIESTGVFNNYANINASEFDYNSDNDICISEISVNPSSDLEITQNVSNFNPKFNDLINWTITVKNNGPDIAHNITVNDMLSNSLIYICDDSDNNYNDDKWFVESMGVGESVNLTLTCRVIGSGEIINNINVSSCEYDYDVSNNQKSISINVNLTSDLSINMTINQSELNYHDLIKWIITIKNNGVDEAHNVKVFDTLPVGFDYIKSTIEYLHNTFDVGNLSAGEEITIEIYCKVNMTGKFINHANIICDEYDYNLTNNKCNLSSLVNPAVDLKITVNASQLTPNYLDNINLTITVTNLGPDNATDIKIYDLLPDAFVYIGDNSESKYDLDTALWDVGEVNVGESKTLTIYTLVNKTGTYINNVNVINSIYDYYLENNNDSVLFNIQKSSNLAIFTSLNSTEIYNGENVKLTVTVKNKGLDNSSSIRLVNVIPDGFVYIDSFLNYSNGVLYINQLNVGNETSFDINLRAVMSGTFINYVNVSSDEFDFDLSDNIVSDTIVVKSSCDLLISSSFSNVNPDYGDYVNLTLTVRNVGFNDAFDVRVYEVLPECLLYQGDDSLGQFDSADGLWSVGDVNVGESKSLTIYGSVGKSGCYVNYVNVSCDVFDCNLENNNDSVAVEIRKVCDLSLITSLNASDINYDDFVKLTVVVKNNGLDNATAVKLVNVIPEGFVYVDSFLNYTGGEFYIGDLRSDCNTSFDINLRALRSDTFINYVNVTSNEFDFDLSNNIVSDTIVVKSSCDLLISSSFSNVNPDYGDYVNLTLTVRNIGFNDAFDVRVYEVLPVCLLYQGDDSLGQFDSADGLWSVGDVSAGESKSLTIYASVGKSGCYVNYVNVSCDVFDCNLENNNDSVAVEIRKVCDLSLITSLNASDINYDDFVKLTVVVKNNGLDNATAVKLVNVIPEGFVYVDSFLNYSNGVLYIDQLNVGKETSFDISLRAVMSGTFINYVNVSSDEFDFDLSNNNVSDIIVVNPCCDLVISSSFSNVNPDYGGYVNLTINVKNIGLDIANNIAVSNLKSDNLIYVSDSLNYNNLEAIWNIDSLDVNDEANLTITYKVNNTGIIVNHVNVSSQTFDYNLDNNYNTTFINVDNNVDLSINASINTSNINYGDSVRLTLTITNNGLNDANDIEIKSIIPEELIIVDSNLNFISKLSNCETAQVYIVFKVNSTGNFILSSNISSSIKDSNLDNNNITLSINVISAADLEVSQNISNANYLDFANVSVYIKNNGPDIAYNVIVTDILPDSLIYVDCDGDYDSLTGSWNIETLDRDDKAVLNILCKVNKTGSFTNTVNITSTTFDYNLENNNCSITQNIPSSVDLMINSQVNASQINYNDLVKLTLTLENKGNDDATGIKIINELPEGFIYYDSILSYTDGVFFIEKLSPNQIISLDVILKAVSTGNFTNIVLVKSGEYDYDVSNNNDSILINVNPAVDLEVITDINTSYAKYGDLINVTVKVTNKGLDIGNNVNVSLSNGLIYENDDSQGKFNSLTGIWDIGRLNVGENQSLSVIFKVNTTGDVQNKVNITSDEYDFDMSNNINSSIVFVEEMSDLSLNAEINATSLNYLDFVKLTLTAENHGLDDADNVKINLNIPQGLDIVNSTLTSMTIENLKVNEKFTIEIILKVNKIDYYIINSNITSNSFDYNLSNNNNNISFNVNPACDLEVYQEVSSLNANYLDLVNLTYVVRNIGLDEASDINVGVLPNDSLIYLCDDSEGAFNYESSVWSIDSLGVGDVKSLTVTYRLNASGEINNSVNVTSSVFDYDLANNVNVISVMVDPACDLSIDASFNVSVVDFGDSIKLTLTVVNCGLDDAYGVVVNVSGSDTFICDNLTLIEVNSLTKGESLTYELLFKVNSTGNYSFNVNVNTTTFDYNKSNNEINIPLTVKPACDLEVYQEVSSLNANYLDLVNWTYVVRNIGLDEASDINVGVLPNDSLIYLCDDSEGAFNYESGVWSIDSLGVGDVRSLTVTYRVNASGEINNSVNVTSSIFDYDLANNVNVTSVMIDLACDLSIDAGFNVSVVDFGDSIKLTLTVVNCGLDDAYGVVVNVTVPDAFICDNLTLIEVNSLTKGESLTYELLFKVNSTGNYSFNVNVNTTTFDYNKSNNEINIPLTVKPASDLEVITVVDNDNPWYLDYINVNITVINHGLDDVSNVLVNTMISDSLIYVDCDLQDYDSISHQWLITSLLKDSNQTLSLTYKVNNTGIFNNSVNVTSNNFDFDLTNNNNSFIIEVASAVDLSVNGSFNASVINYGDLVKLTLNVSNRGINNATGVMIEINIPDDLMYCESTLTLSDDVINVGDLDSGEEKVIELIFKAISTGFYTISSSIDSDNYDNVEYNNEASFSININPAVDLSIVSSFNESVVNYNDFIKLTLNIANSGINTASNLTISNIIPDNFIFINSTSNYDNGIIKIDNLDVEDNIVVEIIYQVNTTGNYSILSNITSDEFDINILNNNASVSILINSSSDLEVINKINSSNFKYGDFVNWTVVIRNNGPDTAHNILVHELIPKTLSESHLMGDVNLNSGEGVIEYLNVGEEIQFNVVGIIDSTGVIENIVSVYALEYDYNISNNQNSSSINVESAVDLIIQCNVNASSLNYHDTVKWTLTITNAGPDSATNVKIINILPEDFIYINSTLEYVNNTFTIDNIQKGEIINIDIITMANANGTFSNFANISVSEEDIYLDNNNASALIIINSAADLEITITANATTSNLNDLINWTIKVKNNGINKAENIQISDSLPDYLIYLSNDLNEDYNPETGIWKINSLDINECAALNIITRVNKTGPVINNVNVTSDVYDYNLNNNYATSIVNINETVDVSVKITLNSTTPHYGDLINWTITAFNNASINATGVEIQNILHADLILINYTLTKGIYNTTHWIIDTLENNTSQSLNLITKLNSTGVILNNAQIKANEYDINASNNNDSLEINVSKSIDIQVKQVISNSNPFVGDNITVQIIVTNNGLSDVCNVSLKNQLADSLTILNINTSKGKYFNNAWNISVIKANTSEYLNISYVVTQSGLISHFVEITAENNMSVSDNVTINATAVVDVYIEESINNTNPKYGDLVNITITVSNKGLCKATNVIIDKQLPEALILINATLTKGTYDENSWFECCLENGEVQSIELICKVNKTGTLTFNVNVTSQEADVNLTNNHANISLNVESEDINITQNSSKINKSIDKPKIIVKKVTNVKKSNKLTKIKITLRGSIITNKKNINFKYNAKGTVKVKVPKSLKNKKVTFTFNNKSYKLKVNKKSIITFKISKKLKKGRYSGVLSWNDYKVYKNKKLTVKFNGKTYNIKTNKKSVATFKVTKKMVKNIKKGKKVKYTITYQNDKLNRYIKIK